MALVTVPMTKGPLIEELNAIPEVKAIHNMITNTASI
jgi:hypothetical protein